MSNTINPFDASRPELQRSIKSSELDDDGLRPDPKKADLSQPDKALSKSVGEEAGNQEKVDPTTVRNQAGVTEPGAQTAARFGATLEGAIDRPEEAGHLNPKDARTPQPLEGLSADEQQLIYRYFPESPSLKLRLYKQDMSADKVDPGSVGSRVDIHG